MQNETKEHSATVLWHFA